MSSRTSVSSLREPACQGTPLACNMAGNAIKKVNPLSHYKKRNKAKRNQAKRSEANRDQANRNEVNRDQAWLDANNFLTASLLNSWFVQVLITPPVSLVISRRQLLLSAVALQCEVIGFRNIRDILYVPRGMADLTANVLRRYDDGSLQAYIAVQLVNLRTWNGQAMQDWNMERFANPHMSLAYQFKFRNYQEFHEATFTMSGFLNSIAGMEIWGTTSLNIGHHHVVLVLGDRSSLFALAHLLRRFLPREAEALNPHVTLNF